MDSLRGFSFYLCFWIVHTAIIEDVVIRRPNETCGTVTIKGPIVSGRDTKVEFLPTPIIPGYSASINCQQSTPVFINMTTNGNIYTYTLKRSTYVNIKSCLVRYSHNLTVYCDTSYFEEQKLITLEGCGLLYMYKRGPIVVVDTVELRYMPADDIVERPNLYIRKWILRPLNSNQTQDIKIENSTITEEQADFNNETVLRLRNISMAISGGISLQCTKNKSENQNTDEIKIQVIENPIFTEPTTATFSDCAKCPEESSTTAVGNDGHGTLIGTALIGAVVPVLAVAVIMIVIACVYRKRKKQRHEQNSVNVHRNDDAPTHPDQNNDRPGDAGVIIQCSTANPENEYACVIPKSQRPERQQEEKKPLAAENDCEYAVVNKERKGRTNSSVHTHLAESEPELNYAELDIQTPPDDHQSQHATVSSETGATEYTSIDFPRTYNNT